MRPVSAAKHAEVLIVSTKYLSLQPDHSPATCKTMVYIKQKEIHNLDKPEPKISAVRCKTILATSLLHPCYILATFYSHLNRVQILLITRTGILQKTVQRCGLAQRLWEFAPNSRNSREKLTISRCERKATTRQETCELWSVSSIKWLLVVNQCGASWSAELS